MEEFDNIRTMWGELNERITALENENRRLARQLISQNYKTAKERLLRKYTGFIAIEIIMLVYIELFVWFNPEVVEKYRLITAIYWGGFFLFELIADSYLRFKLKKIDVYNSSVREISIQATQNWKIHKICIVIGLPLAIGAVILFSLLLNANEFIILGMIFGALVGVLIGLRQLKRFYDNYKLMRIEEY